MKINKIIVYLLLASVFLSCNKHINVFITGTLLSNNFTDTFSYNKDDKFIVIHANVDNVDCNLMFDTGADYVVFFKSNSKSNIISKPVDSNGNKSYQDINMIPINSFKFLNRNVKNVYALNTLLPAPFLCYCNGIMGNNVIKSCNWLIGKEQILISDKPFETKDQLLVHDIFYYGENGLRFNVNINGSKADTCGIDYGDSSGDIILSQSFYKKNHNYFKPNTITNIVTTSYGANGKSLPDTITRLNCNIDFNGIKIDSVNIDIVKKVANRVGFRFLKRFENIVINNNKSQIIFGVLDNTYNKFQSNPLLLFDYIDGYFEIKRKQIIPELSDLNVGDKFVEINSVKCSDIKSYCDFLNFSDKLQDSTIMELKTSDNKIIKINNRH